MKFDLSVLDKNVLKITGIPQDEQSVEYVVNVIKYKSSQSDEATILDYIITKHNEETNTNEALYTFTKDGHYILDHLIMLSLDKAIEVGLQGYCADDNNLYKIEKGEYTICSIDEIIEVNDPSVIKYNQETFSICYLHECYLELCNNKFKWLMRNRCTKQNDLDNFDLDLIGLSLSAIRYNLEFGYMSTAQSIIEDIYKCVNVCKNNVKYECGCCN